MIFIAPRLSIIMLMMAPVFSSCGSSVARQSAAGKSLEQAIDLAGKSPDLTAVSDYMIRSGSLQNNIMVNLEGTEAPSKVVSELSPNGSVKVIHVLIDENACINHPRLVEKVGAVRSLTPSHGDEIFKYVFYGDVVVSIVAWPDRRDCTQSVNFRVVSR